MFPDKEFDRDMAQLFEMLPEMDKEFLATSITLAINYMRIQQISPRRAGKMERVHQTTVALDRLWRRYGSL